MTKKGQGLSLNTVIIAIIVLVVLVVLVMIFTGYFGKIFTPSVKSCSTQGGQCAAQCNTGDLGSEVSGADCPKTGTNTKCCATVKTQFTQRDSGADVASCRTQGFDCEKTGTADINDLDNDDNIAELVNCGHYLKQAYAAPGCEAGTTCCK